VALARLNTPEAREALRVQAASSSSESVRRFAARALETSCVQALVAELAAADADWPMELLGDLRATEALPALDAAARSPDSYMRFVAHLAARRIRRLAEAQTPPAAPATAP
jgi:hypothetical protein